jgi:hypothetical protein
MLFPGHRNYPPVTRRCLTGQIITLKRALSASFYTCRNMNVKSSFVFFGDLAGYQKW